MSTIKVEWISIDKIKTQHKITTAPTRYHFYHSTIDITMPYIHVIRNRTGEVLLHKGIKVYNLINTSQLKRQIPVYVTENKDITSLDWTFLLFQSCIEENVSSSITYQYLSILLEETRNDIKKICYKTGCTKEQIYSLILDDTIPEKYKDLAVQYNRIHMVNEIARNPRLQNYRSVLYPAVFQAKNRLTTGKLKLFLLFLDAGYDLNVNSILALENFNRIVNLDEALKFYWDHLKFPDTTIMEGVFYLKGDKHSKINVRL